MLVAEDLAGFPCEVGDRIAYSTRDGDTAGMRIGEIIKITPAVEHEDRWSRKPLKIQVRILHTTGYSSAGGTATINAELKRFVCLDAAS